MYIDSFIITKKTNFSNPIPYSLVFLINFRNLTKIYIPIRPNKSTSNVNEEEEEE